MCIGPENAQTFFIKLVYNSHYKRLLWANNSQLNPFIQGKLQQTLYIVCRNGNIFCYFTCPGVTRCTKDCFYFWTLFYFPDQSMFTPAISNNQNLHMLSLESMYNSLMNLYKMPSSCNYVYYNIELNVKA